MTTQPEALRLADYLTDRNRLDLTCDEAADELRRLHEVNTELLAALKEGVDETLDYIKLNHLTGAEKNHWIVQAQAAINKAERTTP